MSITYQAAAATAQSLLLPAIKKLYGLEGCSFSQIPPHDGGRNLVYTCHKAEAQDMVIRISFLDDRSKDDFVGELEYICYLHEHGGSVSNVIHSKNGRLLEEIQHEGQVFFICLFERAPGKQLAENHYRYRDGAPLTEYFYNCGKTLGKLHQLSKAYQPTRRRYDFFDKYNKTYIEQIVPDFLSPTVKEKLFRILEQLQGLNRHSDHYGMVHFDYSDGNYNIDYDNGQITVFDFDNSCFCWYMYDLAGLWGHGVGWIQFEKDVNKRMKFMEDYFETVLDGYRSETDLDDAMLEQLPLFIQTTILEDMIDAFEVAQHNGEQVECDEALLYLIKCLEEDIPYKGFFHDIYSFEAPFQYKENKR
ncbi:MAG: phosphotransferase [Paenibacillus dendritiformis]|uniref:phosphotransferase enzyme family protein n=1 Tax=uncultured Paenibacillus sp. TaxID=227322 RepID=UPI0025D6764B|nr:phosphotransferase [uncultured Paenibacillus sp.]MDU5145520.1 phosphotransferase [Paenibacillus dendritiformis]